jgi:nitric oxide reductase activation protein
VIWADAEPHVSGYERVRQDVARQVAALRERLRIVLPPRRETGLQRGSLDRRRLHRHRFDHRLFRGPELCPDPLAIALILDLSGSMSGPHAELAQRIAVLVAAAAEGLPGVRLYVYGHSADRDSDGSRRNPSTHITRFATPARGRVLSLGELPVGGNNRDAHAFRVIGQDLVRLGGAGSTRKLAVIIADGLPNAIGFDGPEAFDATRRAIVWLEQIWGPVIFVATGSHARLHSLVTGPLYKYDPKNPVSGLVTMIQMALRKT